MQIGEPIVRLACFFSVLAAMSLWEIVAPRRRLTVSKPMRWASNLGLSAINTLVTRSLAALGAVGIAGVAAERGWGLFNHVELPGWLWPTIGIAALLAVIGDGGLGFLGRALLIVLVVPYVFLGLAVIHAAAGRWPHRRVALALCYGAIMLLGWPILAVLLLGFVEDWAHVRQRFL